MAVPSPSFRAVPTPTRDEAEALRLVEEYLTRAGAPLANRLLGCPVPNREGAIGAEFGNALLRGTALRAGLRDLADAGDRRDL